MSAHREESARFASSNRRVHSTERIVSRRVALRSGLVGATGLWLGDRAQSATASATPVADPKAKAVIQIWMWGGPSHIDTFDPKPRAGNDYCGPLTGVNATNVSGIRIGEMLPILGKQADKFSIIRSMTHGVNAHETASYLVQTGRKSGGDMVFPSVGAVVSWFKGQREGGDSLIPPYIVLTQPQGRFSEAGFLGSRYKPFATGGDPGKDPFVVEGVVAQGVTTERQRRRRELMHRLNSLGNALPNDRRIKAFNACEEKAYDLILGEAGKVFDLTTEKESLREQYGRSTFGQACLMARRLVEQGVRYVTINYRGWDTHKQHFQIMRRKLPELDRGMGTLLRDLADRGLLDSTIVWWTGEFGRTPRVKWEAPWNGGRGHFGRVFSSVVAGGGFQGGQVVGASDDKAQSVADRPVYPTDLIGSMYSLLGIDRHANLPHPQGLDVEVMPQTPGASGGLLKEIM